MHSAFQFLLSEAGRDIGNDLLSRIHLNCGVVVAVYLANSVFTCEIMGQLRGLNRVDTYVYVGPLL